MSGVQWFLNLIVNLLVTVCQTGLQLIKNKRSSTKYCIYLKKPWKYILFQYKICYCCGILINPVFLWVNLILYIWPRLFDALYFRILTIHLIIFRAFIVIKLLLIFICILYHVGCYFKILPEVNTLLIQMLSFP